MEKQMETIVTDEKVASARNTILLNLEHGWGGYSVFLYRGSYVNIKTRFGNEYSGWIDRYEPALNESDHDGIVIVTDREDGSQEQTKVGLQHITFMEVEKRGRVD